MGYGYHQISIMIEMALNFTTNSTFVMRIISFDKIPCANGKYFI